MHLSNFVDRLWFQLLLQNPVYGMTFSEEELPVGRRIQEEHAVWAEAGFYSRTWSPEL